MAQLRPAGYMREKKMSQRQRAQKVQQELKAGMACAHCGVSDIDPKRLHWHHVDPQSKRRNVGKMRTIVGVRRELEKCILLCGSCHNREHARLRRAKNALTPVTARFAGDWQGAAWHG